MIIGNIWQLKELSLDDFVISYNDTFLETEAMDKYFYFLKNFSIFLYIHIQNLS